MVIFLSSLFLTKVASACEWYKKKLLKTVIVSSTKNNSVSNIIWLAYSPGLTLTFDKTYLILCESFTEFKLSFYVLTVQESYVAMIYQTSIYRMQINILIGRVMTGYGQTYII